MAEVPIPHEGRKLDGRGRPRLDGLRAWYSIPRLALVLGVSARELETLLPKWMIAQDGGPGTLRRVYVNRLKQEMPDLYNSLLDLEAARATAAKLGAAQPRRRSTDFEPFDHP